MNKPIPHLLSFLRPVSTVSVAAILIYEPLPYVVLIPMLCIVKCCLPRSGMNGVRGHGPSQYSLCLSSALCILPHCMLLKLKQGRRAQAKGGSRKGGHKGTKMRGEMWEQ